MNEHRKRIDWEAEARRINPPKPLLPAWVVLCARRLVSVAIVVIVLSLTWGAIMFLRYKPEETFWHFLARSFPLLAGVVALLIVFSICIFSAMWLAFRLWGSE